MVPTRKRKFLSIINDINQSERLIRLVHMVDGGGQQGGRKGKRGMGATRPVFFPENRCRVAAPCTSSLGH
jgi:hypothetical protein